MVRIKAVFFRSDCQILTRICQVLKLIKKTRWHLSNVNLKVQYRSKFKPNIKFSKIEKFFFFADFSSFTIVPHRITTTFVFPFQPKNLSWEIFSEFWGNFYYGLQLVELFVLRRVQMRDRDHGPGSVEIPGKRIPFSRRGSAGWGSLKVQDLRNCCIWLWLVPDIRLII